MSGEEPAGFGYGCEEGIEGSGLEAAGFEPGRGRSDTAGGARRGRALRLKGLEDVMAVS